jgi:hypothetical protein
MHVLSIIHQLPLFSVCIKCLKHTVTFNLHNIMKIIINYILQLGKQVCEVKKFTQGHRARDLVCMDLNPTVWKEWKLHESECCHNRNCD